MKKYFIILIIIVGFVTIAYSWGFWGHKKINNMAVSTLPSELIGLYKNHIDYIIKHAVDADRRRYSNKDEAARHYIDIDHYGMNPFDNMPQSWKEAVAKYTEDTLKEYGILPWYVDKMLYRLTEAFKQNNVDEILYLSANLGHYVADAHVPLHTTENYNGQLTHQEGIHSLWETRLPELYGNNYQFFVGRSHYIKKPLQEIWDAIKTSHAALDSVLPFEKQLNEKFPQDKKYALERKGKKMLQVYSEEYAKQYNDILNNMIERRMQAAVLAVGSFWYTAWVNAGQPDLHKFENATISDSLKLQHKKEEEMKLKKIIREKGHTD